MMPSPKKLRFAAMAAILLAFCSFLLPSTWTPGSDFTWRYNEVQCLRSGLDPYAVCFENVPSPEFRSIFKHEPGKRPVNSYSPWQYTWFLPLSFLPLQSAHSLFMLLNLGALALLAALSYKRALRIGLAPEKALATAAATCFLGLALVRVLQVSNYGLLMAAALMLLSECPASRPYALCILMIKPQIGILFTIPLLLSRQWRAVLIAALITSLSVLPAAALCHTNPLRMVLHVLFSGSQSIRASEIGTGLIPPPLLQQFLPIAPASVWLAASALLGLYLCIVASKRLRHHPDPAVQLLPATVLSLLWMPGHFHDRLLLALPISLFASQLLQGKRSALPHFLLFTAEFWLCLLAGIAALFLFPRNPLSLIQQPIARTVYDWSLFLVGWLQIYTATQYDSTHLPS